MSTTTTMQEDAKAIAALTVYERRHDVHRVRKVHKFRHVQDDWSENDVQAFTLVLHAISCKGRNNPACTYTKQILRHICVCPTCGDCQICAHPPHRAKRSNRTRLALSREASVFVRPGLTWKQQVVMLISTLVTLVLGYFGG